MSFWEKWLRYPQSLAVRKVLFQVHLWTGIGLGLYVLLMSITGTVLIYRVDLARRFSREPAIVPGPARMTVDELKQAAQRAYPDYEVGDVLQRRRPNLAVEILLQNGDKRLERLFNPFTGADLGDSVTARFRFLQWLVSLHDDLLFQPTGRLVNGVGAIIVTLLCLSGAVIWWPGTGKWRSRLTINWQADRRRLNWALHNALGFWSIAFVLMWGISGIYLSFPAPFNAVIDFLEPANTSSRKLRFGDRVLAWLSQAHFGRFAGLPVKLVWTVFGLLPIVLFVTGTLMWWKRVLRPMLGRGLAVQSEMNEVKQAGD